MSKKFDVVVTQRYQDRDGNEQKKYVNIGAVIETSKGLSLKLEAVPVGWDGWAGFYEPKAKDGAAKPAGRQRNDDDDSIPF